MTRFLSFFGFFVFLSIFFAGSVQAQLEGPIDREEQITASVVPQNAPPPVILIAPTNGQHLNDDRVEFRWREVTGHTVPLDRYELSLNGVVLFDNIPLTPTSNADYTLTLIDGVYRLKLSTAASLDDGTYTWKIRVIDTQDRGTDSATWVFTVDTVQPPIVVTNIQGQEVSISASDPSTIPEEPVVVHVEQPYIYGSTEPLANVQLVITRGDGSQHAFQMIATSDGHFLFFTPELNPYEIISLTFTATDLANNIRTLSGLRIQYVPRQIVIPLPEIVPGQPEEIIIPVPEIPGLPFEPTPPPLKPDVPTQPPLQAAPQIFERPVISHLRWWRAILLLFLFLYALTVFIWTANTWWLFLPWLGRLLFWWLLWPEKQDRTATPRNKSVPWVRWKVEWLEDKKLRRRRVWTSPGGWFDLPQAFPAIQTLELENRNWKWLPIPSDQELPDSYVGARSLTLARAKSPVPDSTLIERDQYIWIWAVPLHASPWRWTLRWLPRLWLFLALMFALWLTWNVPTLVSFIWLFVCIWCCVRDLQAQLPQRWSAWQDGETV